MTAVKTILFFLVPLLIWPLFTCKPRPECVNKKVILKHNLPLAAYMKTYKESVNHWAQPTPIPRTTFSTKSTTSKTQSKVSGSDLQDSIKCGTVAVDNIDPIIQGHNAAEKSYPWQVYIQSRKGSCGGVLISSQWVLTAAHCINKTKLIILGTNDLHEQSPKTVINSTLKEIIHENYDAINNFNDIALIKMNTEVQFNDYIRPACIPNGDDSFEHVKNCYLTGWGITFVEPRIDTSLLQELKVDVISNFECSTRWVFKQIQIIAGHLCTSENTEELQGSCYGDSGGPLSCRVGSAFYVAGLASFVYRKCQKGILPDVYTRVSFYREWIENTMFEN